MRKALMAALIPVVLAGCGKLMGSTGSDCGGEEATAVLQKTLQKSVQDSVKGALAQSESQTSYTTSQIRALAGKLVLHLTDVRTSRDDPDSTKKLCNAVATVSLPAGAVDDVDSVRTMRNESRTSDWARDFDVEPSGGGFKADLEYSIQPTDDGSKIFAELPTDQGLVNFVTQMLAVQLRSREIKEAAAEQSRLEAEQRAQQAQAEQEVEQANQELEVASVEEARTSNRLARQTINALWSSVPRESLGPILPLQRAWVQKKDAQCKLEAASSSTDPEQKAIAFLSCDTRLTNERIGWLRQNLPAQEYQPD